MLKCMQGVFVVLHFDWLIVKSGNLTNDNVLIKIILTGPVSYSY